MSSHQSKTPYNSIYEQLQVQSKSQKSEPRVTCCLHGAPCAKNEKDKPEENYVNLMSPSKEEKMASLLANKLSRLTSNEKTDKKKKAEFVSLTNVVEPEGSQPKSAKKSKKKVQPPTEDDHSYVMLGNPNATESQSQRSEAVSMPTSDISSNPATEDPFANQVSIEKSLKKTARRSNVKSESASIYIGVMSREEAEDRVKNGTLLALYHRMTSSGTLDSLDDGLPLILVYLTASRSIRHLPVRTDSNNGDVHYFVDYGGPNVRRHLSLNQLIRYHKRHHGLTEL